MSQNNVFVLDDEAFEIRSNSQLNLCIPPDIKQVGMCRSAGVLSESFSAVQQYFLGA
ncbi:hypothetical protein N7931_00090 [Catenovulum sp. 2E275]|uniref:hypothetical protein n=1 Tax=Catenovulum sp. 2E275 TaxID=2980497 RepID=UPI0021D3E517|nr:hypothetical protein [Catenovulum sp. 2E275]MCU4674019.1 hypothetical protein [Catenovulum sp. 2E275]